jgi:hypothetical protein
MMDIFPLQYNHGYTRKLRFTEQVQCNSVPPCLCGSIIAIQNILYEYNNKISIRPRKIRHTNRH